MTPNKRNKFHEFTALPLRGYTHTRATEENLSPPSTRERKMGSSRSWECIVLLFSVAVEFSPLSLPTSLLRLGPNFRERRGVGGMIARDPTNLRLVVSAAGRRPSLPPAPKRTRCLFVPASVGVTTHPPRGGAANCHCATAYIYIYIYYLSTPRHCKRFVSREISHPPSSSFHDRDKEWTLESRVLEIFL